MNADKANLLKILGLNIEIPFFQRSYVWDLENCKTLLEDIEQSLAKEQPLFLGCVVLKAVPKKSVLTQEICNLIDGQQRVTTLSILLKVISLLVPECKAHFDSKFFTDSKYNVQHNHYDAVAFSEVMNKTNLEKYKDTKNKIYNTFNLYVDALQNKSDDELKNLFNYSVHSIIVIAITVEADEDEQKIFDSLNSLGVRLTTAELLKNYLFNSKDDVDIKLFEDGWVDNDGRHHAGWKKCFEADEDTKGYWDAEITHGRIKRSNIDLLLHSFLSIQSINSNGVYSKLDDLFESYKDFLKDKDAEFKHNIIKELCSLSETYKKHIKYDTASIAPKNDVERLNLLLFAGQLTTAIPYFVYLLSDYNDNSSALNPMCKCLAGYLLRRFIVGATAKNYNNFFALLIREKVNSVDAFMTKVKDKAETNGIPSDAEVRAKIYTTEFDTNDKPKIILYLLESFLNNENTVLPLGEYGRYELEHIMPKKWQEYWGEVNKDVPEHTVRQHILNIGNMTLLTSPLNKTIKNKSWDIKLNGQTIKNKKYEGYNEYVKGIYIFDEKYLQKSNWNVGVIDERAKDLADKLIKTWAL